MRAGETQACADAAAERIAALEEAAEAATAEYDGALAEAEVRVIRLSTGCMAHLMLPCRTANYYGSTAV
jgi:hypothetical protein